MRTTLWRYHLGVGLALAVAYVYLPAPDSGRALLLLTGTYDPTSAVEAGWLVSYALWGAAVLEPSVDTLTDPAPPARAGLTRARLASLATAALRGAIDREELVVHYQPIVDLRTWRVGATEALVRWPRPDCGLVPPAELVPIAEETGLVVDIDRLVLRESCRQAAGPPTPARPDAAPAQRSPAACLARRGPSARPA